MEDPRLFDAEPDEAHVHLAWQAETGWSVWVNAWPRCDGPGSAQSEGYERLTFGEALDVTCAALASRMPWLF